MRKFKKFVSLVAAAALLVLLPATSKLTVSAEEPRTYYLKYVESESEWRYQDGTPWDDTKQHRELYYMHQGIKDGDLLVVEGGGDPLRLEVNVQLSNLTLNKCQNVVVTANGIDECYVLGDALSAVNGDVKHAYIYANSATTFNNNVDTIDIQDTGSIRCTVTAGGTVSHLIGKNDSGTVYEGYNFATGTLNIQSGVLKTDASNYSTSASSTQNTTQSSQPTQSAPSGSSDEYDDVPKTGESTVVIWLFAASVLCFGSAYLLKKRTH